MVFLVISHIALFVFLLTCLSVGAKEAGAAGFFKGLGKGMVGVLARPAWTCPTISHLVQSDVKALLRAFIDVLIDNDEKVASYKKNKQTNKLPSRLECKNHTLFMTKMAKIS